MLSYGRFIGKASRASISMLLAGQCTSGQSGLCARALYKRLISGQLVRLYMTSLGIVSIQSMAMKPHGRSLQGESQG